MSVSIRWHGHSTFSIDVDGTKLVVDPFFDDNPVAKVKAASVPADYILLTHGHGDHTADALPMARRTGATLISNFEIVNWVNAHGHDKTHGQHIGGGFQHPFGHVKMTIAFHGSSFPDGTYAGMPGGFLLTIGGKKVYVAGDTAVYSDMALIGRAGLDVAVLPIGDNFTMGPEDSLLALEYLQPKVVIPCHYNTWGFIMVDVEAWAASVRQRTQAKPVVLAVEESFTVP
jgi:L-ascorbate metabolism protein UlaG (beta-lactamase superfamily)